MDAVLICKRGLTLIERSSPGTYFNFYMLCSCGAENELHSSKYHFPKHCAKTQGVPLSSKYHFPEHCVKNPRCAFDLNTCCAGDTT